LFLFSQGSTKLTQNSNLLHLLQWQSDKENITETLTRVLRLRDEELVKFLQDVLDALFGELKSRLETMETIKMNDYVSFFLLSYVLQ
jgi:hypothetical protein